MIARKHVPDGWVACIHPEGKLYFHNPSNVSLLLYARYFISSSRHGHSHSPLTQLANIHRLRRPEPNHPSPLHGARRAGLPNCRRERTPAAALARSSAVPRATHPQWWIQPVLLLRGSRCARVVLDQRRKPSVGPLCSSTDGWKKPL